ncbi:lipopolysaccharide biosynthesis protein [Cerasicoccus frondis]|uniref:lipopolysaccharide biosynthesis protein n=1 Tax=Cerasicoccus frondis TaxID=490090 RepID=UPI002852D404|nr:polysaccharide biosynthesis C-terminal domain-containing protein [Cerasicoccus frondis]
MADPVIKPEWKRRFWANTGSSYVQVVLRLILGLILFRQLFSGLSEEAFGFWSLLWSLFGYGVLLDFGFGFTAQKAVAEKMAQGDMAGLNRLLATIFWTFVGLAVALVVAFLLLRPYFMQAVSVSADDWAAFSRAYIIFFIGMALTFPLGLFPEVLRGLQRIDLANWVGVGNTILHFSAIVTALALNWPFPALMTISVISSLIPNIFAAIFAFRLIKELSLTPRLFEWRSVKAQMSFSIAAYLITFSNLIMAKSDQLVLSLTIGVASVALYQAGFKMGEMLNLFSVQLQAALSPAAAHLKASGDEAGLRELLMRSSRLTFVVVTPAYVLSAVYLDGLIMLLTGLDEVPHEVYWVGQALLLAIYSSQLTNSCTKRILMMTGHEKALLRLSIIDAVLNVAVSFALVFPLGILGVALGTLIPTALIGWFFILPITLRAVELKPGRFLAFHADGSAWPLGSFAIVLILLLFVAPFPESGGLWSLAWRGALAGVPWLWFSRKLIKGMTL